MDPQIHQVWSDEFQRWLQLHYDHQHQRWYRAHYVEGQGWVFFDWLPIQANHGRNDSGNAASAQSIRQTSEVRQGPVVHGFYDYENPLTYSSYEQLDPSYYVRDKTFFKDGKVFSVLFTEAAGTTVTKYNDAFSAVKLGGVAHTQIRRFIVVRQKREFCFAIPIFTYNNQGTLKHGVVPREHAIAYSIGYQPPTLLPGEVEIVKQPIGIVMKPGEPCLAAASRIYFGIHHPIQYNVKVKDLGDVHPNDLVNLKGYWNMENQTDTNQDIDVTAQAAWESPQQYGGLPDQPQHQSSRRRQQG